MKKVLVVAAHPDDELLGVGGTIAKHVRLGDEVYAVVMCEGEAIRYKKDVGQRNMMQEAAKVLGIKKIYHLEFPDQRLDTFTLTEIIAPLEKLSNKIKPNIIYCQHGGDANRDHKILFEAANIAFRPLNEWIEEFYTFYTVSSTEWGESGNFRPDTWVDITETLSIKLEAFQCYESELREYPHPRSVKALEYLAHFYGNQCCVDAAEAFHTVRRRK